MDAGSLPPRPARAAAGIALALYLLIAIVQLHGVFLGWSNLGANDWNGFTGQAQAEATTLLDHGQFPAWNPWRRGGQVSFAQPESMFLSPVTPLALLFGANAAMKLLLVPLFVLAGMGMWALAGDLGLRGVARLVPGAAFLGASALPLYVLGGLPSWLFGMAILPWLLLASRRAARRRVWIVVGGALLAALLFCGSVHHFVFFPLLLALEAAARSIRKRSWRPLVATAALGIAGVAFSLVRLVPLLEVFSEFPRRIDAGNRYMPLAQLARSLLLPAPADVVADRRVFVTGGSALYWVDCGAYVGPVVALLALLGIVLAWRRAWPCALLGASFLWLALGSSVRLSLWDALHRLPVYASMQSPQRFMGYGVFAIALLAGLGAGRVGAKLERWGARVRAIGILVLLLAAIVPLLIASSAYSESAFPVAPPADVAPSTLFARQPPPPPFEQRVYPTISAQFGGPLHEAVLRNAGNLDGQSDVPSKRAARAKTELGYRGELYLASTVAGDQPGPAVRGTITPNRITAHVELAADDLLVVNQTFFPGWRARGAIARDCVDHDGLIALPLPAGVHDIVLEYAPGTIPAGAALTLGAIAIAVGWWAVRRRAAPALPLARRVDRVAIALDGLLVAGVVGWYVTRTPSGAGAPPTPWHESATRVVARPQLATLQQAVDAARPGDVLQLSGNFGAVVVRHGVILVADPTASVASVHQLLVQDLPKDETLVLVDVQAGSPDRPIPGDGTDAGRSGTWRVERCEGRVLLAPRASDPPSPFAFSVDSSPATFVFGAALAHGVEVRGGALALVDCSIAPPLAERDGAPPSRAALDVEHGALVLQRVDAGAGRVQLRDHATAAASSSSIAKPAVDETSSWFDRDAQPRSLRLELAGGVTQSGGGEVRILGPPRASGTLVVARRPAFVPLKGRSLGQFLLCDFDGSQVLYPFDLDEHGTLAFALPPSSDDYRPGDGFFVQAWLPDGDDPKGRNYSLLEGGPIVPDRPVR